MRPLQVVELLPDGQLGAQVDVAGVVEQLVELELVGEVRALGPCRPRFGLAGLM